ncbi:hypothetical protein C8J57DRAFT_1470289 [Mycena rebaudengoi]|nr:hypothetical protein C8J57DRAFT_1470289 [Mycena rebaudengoi]
MDAEKEGMGGMLRRLAKTRKPTAIRKESKKERKHVKDRMKGKEGNDGKETNARRGAVLGARNWGRKIIWSQRSERSRREEKMKRKGGRFERRQCIGDEGCYGITKKFAEKNVENEWKRGGELWGGERWEVNEKLAMHALGNTRPPLSVCRGFGAVGEMKACLEHGRGPRDAKEGMQRGHKDLKTSFEIGGCNLEARPKNSGRRKTPSEIQHRRYIVLQFGMLDCSACGAARGGSVVRVEVGSDRARATGGWYSELGGCQGQKNPQAGPENGEGKGQDGNGRLNIKERTMGRGGKHKNRDGGRERCMMDEAAVKDEVA